MTDLQSYFEEFHSKIKLDDENDILREKRGILLDKLQTRISEMFEEKGETPPKYTHFDKGSYAMHLGVVPLNSDFDIDEGLEFDIDKNDYPDPVIVKQWVYDALSGHTDDVKIKQPCVTVQYHLNDEPCYHVDFAVYGHDGTQNGIIYLSRGKPGSDENQKRWEQDDPKGLIKAIGEIFPDEDDRYQYRRIIRYLKRWKDIKFSSDGNEAPIGVALTVAGYHWFQPAKELLDPVANSYKYQDLKALRSFIDEMISNFKSVYHDDELAERLEAQLMVEPYNDLFEKMTNLQMANLKEKLIKLRDVLSEVDDEDADPVEACKKLQKQFGEDFPVPEAKDTGQTRGPAIISSSTSA
jgi:hypothetical protein